MYWCNECKGAYPDSDLEVIDMSEDETWTQCGHCGGTDIDRADKCRCGNWKNTREEFCEDCKTNLIYSLVDAVHVFKEIYRTSNEWKVKEEIKAMLDDLYGR